MFTRFEYNVWASENVDQSEYIVRVFVVVGAGVFGCVGVACVVAIVLLVRWFYTIK